jgi:hypothetical protein
MGNLVGQTIDVLDVYEGRDAAITFTLYFCCLLSGFYPRKSATSRTLIRIFKRLESCRVVLRLFDDLGILRDTLTYDLKPGVRNVNDIIIFFDIYFLGKKWNCSCFEMFTLSIMDWFLCIRTYWLARRNESN